MVLTDADHAMLSGTAGDALALAMRVIVHTAEAMGATELLDITGGHIDGCLFTGVASLDFARELRDGGATVRVPTTLNVSSLDLLHPELYRGDTGKATLSRELMQCYEDMGCRPTWTCAPYQLPSRPGFGEHVAWGESNAIVFANSVLGARTHRYGDFTDISAALTGRAPAAGLHLDENRRGELVFQISGLPDALLDHDTFYPVAGFLVGSACGQRVPVVDGLPPTVTEDQLKAFGAAAASSGSVGLFHIVGVTPEAPDLTTALGGSTHVPVIRVTPADVSAARRSLSTVTGGTLGAVSLGTPHYSRDEIRRLVDLIGGRSLRSPFYVNMGRDTLAAIGGIAGQLAAAGVTVVTDTCTYLTPVMAPPAGAVMTDSAKWAYYAPGNIGVDVIYASAAECVESAVAGHVIHDEGLWTDG